MICDVTSVSDELDCIQLSSGGLGSCMNALMIYNGITIGTLSIANESKPCYSEAEAIQLQCSANWNALNIHYFKRQTQCLEFAGSRWRSPNIFSTKTKLNNSNKYQEPSLPHPTICHASTCDGYSQI